MSASRGPPAWRAVHRASGGTVTSSLQGTVIASCPLGLTTWAPLQTSIQSVHSARVQTLCSYWAHPVLKPMSVSMCETSSAKLPLHAADTSGSMGAILVAFQKKPLSDCNARLCRMRARARNPPKTPLQRNVGNRASLAKRGLAFVVRRVHGQVYWRARSDPHKLPLSASSSSDMDT